MMQSDAQAVLDTVGLEALREDLEDAFGPFVRGFLERAEAAFREMAGAAGAGRWPEVAEAAHSLKGGALYLGAVELSARLAALQQCAGADPGADRDAALTAAREAFERVAPLLADRSGG